MSFYKIITLAIIMSVIVSSCGDTGRVYETPDARKKFTTPIYHPDTAKTIMSDTVATIDLSSPHQSKPPSSQQGVDVENNQLVIDLASIAGGAKPTQVTVKVNLLNGVIQDYTVTTSASRPHTAPVSKKGGTAFVISNYTIQAGDTKSSLARKFGIDPTRIKNKVLKTGEKLEYE